MHLLRDLRRALRGFSRRPALTLGIVLTLAIGLGANTAIFTFFAHTFWNRFPAPNPERLYWVRPGTQEQLGWEMSYQDWTEHRQALGDLGQLEARGGFSAVIVLPGRGSSAPGSSAPGSSAQGGGATATTYGFGAAVSDGFFELFSPGGMAHGRGFSTAEHAMAGSFVVVLDHGFWRHHLGADPSLVGRSIMLNGRSFTVIGVTPPGYQGEGWVYQLYIPLRQLDAVSLPPLPIGSPNIESLAALLALPPGVGPEAATARLETTARHLDTAFPLPQGQRRVALQNVLDTGAVFQAQDMALTGAVACLLILACANVANLLLARAVARRREIAVQAALGAGPARISRFLLIESTVLALVGGGLALAVARALLAVFRGIIEVRPMGLGVWGQGTLGPQLDARAVFFTLGLSLLAGLLFGLAPVLSAARCDLVSQLKSGGLGSGDGRRFSARHLLVVTQVTLATVLLVGAGLLMRSLDSLQRGDPGYDTEQQLLAIIAVNPARDADPTARLRTQRQLFDAARQRLEALPGIISAALVSEAPGSTVVRRTRLVLPEQPDARLTVERMQVGPGFFDTLGIDVQRGRAIDERDVTGGTGAVVVSRAFVDRHWPGESALGRSLRLPDLGGDTESDRFIVVGVAADIAHVSRLREPLPAVYLPVAQYLWGTRMTLVAHTVGDPSSAMAPVQDLLRGVHSDLALVEIATYARQVAVDLEDERLHGTLATLFGGFGLVLACLGIYSVMNVSVGYRVRELGIRMALGASARDVMTLVLAETLVMVALGVVVGILGALALGRSLGGFLHGVSSYEPVIFVAVPILLACVALVSAWVPAWRAGQIQPKNALLAD